MSEALIARLIEAGTPAALVAEVAMELAKAQAATNLIEDRRRKDRERKRVDALLPRNSTETVEVRGNGGIPPAKEIPPDPHKKITPLLVKSNDLTSPRRLPDDFIVPDDWIEWAVTKRKWSNAEAIEEAKCFCRYWQAKGRDAAKRSWKKTWQNWVMNSRRKADGTSPASDLDVLMASVERKYGTATSA